MRAVLVPRNPADPRKKFPPQENMQKKKCKDKKLTKKILKIATQNGD